MRWETSLIIPQRRGEHSIPSLFPSHAQPHTRYVTIAISSLLLRRPSVWATSWCGAPPVVERVSTWVAMRHALGGREQGRVVRHDRTLEQAGGGTTTPSDRAQRQVDVNSLAMKQRPRARSFTGPRRRMCTTTIMLQGTPTLLRNF